MKIKAASAKVTLPKTWLPCAHIALNLLKQEKTAKGGMHARQLQAGRKEDYLLKVLASEI